MTNKPVISSLSNENNYLTDIEFGKHKLQSDEPVDFGGSDNGMDPLSLALASLGACTAMTLKIYYAHKKADWKQIDVHVSTELAAIDKNSASDELVAMANNGKIRKIFKTIYIKSDMDDKLLSRASIIAEKCPVNLMMKRSCEMETVIKRI